MTDVPQRGSVYAARLYTQCAEGHFRDFLNILSCPLTAHTPYLALGFPRQRCLRGLPPPEPADNSIRKSSRAPNPGKKNSTAKPIQILQSLRIAQEVQLRCDPYSPKTGQNQVEKTKTLLNYPHNIWAERRRRGG